MIFLMGAFGGNATNWLNCHGQPGGFLEFMENVAAGVAGPSSQVKLKCRIWLEI